jgi:ribonucleoside-diphosphate reductase beta chain
MRAKNGRNGRNQQVLGASTGPQMDLLPLPGLMTPSAAYKPFRYPWAVELWRRQQQIHWLPEEVPLGEDCKDWATRLTDPERNLLTQVFRFFTQSDVEVQDNYLERYARVFRPTEVKMMLAAFANMETVHIVAYALLLETIGMPDTEFAAFMDYRAMRDKHDYMQRFGVASEADILRTLAMFGGFTEGLQLFASFAILLNFPRHNKMRGMGQIVSWSVRDESLHCEGIIRLFHTFAAETGALTRSVREDIVDCARTVVALEDKFIDLAFEMGPIEGLDAEEVKRYIRYVADWRLRQLGLPEIYEVGEHPLPWLTEILNGVEHANFFETRATEYAKAATGGDWHGAEGAWGIFDARLARQRQIDLLQSST